MGARMSRAPKKRERPEGGLQDLQRDVSGRTPRWVAFCWIRYTDRGKFMTLSARRPGTKGRKALLLSGVSLAVLGIGGGAYAYASTGSSGPSRMDCSQTTASGTGEEFTVSQGEVVLVRGNAAVRTPAGRPATVGVGETLEVRQGEAVLTLNNMAWRIKVGDSLQVRQGDIIATYGDGKQLTTARCHRG